jgi:hypothetical protein
MGCLLKKCFSKGNVNYKAFQKIASNCRPTLMSYLQMYLLNHGLRMLLAYWINAYNAYTVKLILDNYPTKSIKDINDPWGKNSFLRNKKI